MIDPVPLVHPLPPCGVQKGLLSEVRPVIAARDLDRFNELTVHAEIAARNVSQLPLSV